MFAWLSLTFEELRSQADIVRSFNEGAAEAASADFINALPAAIREEVRAFQSGVETALADLPDVDRDLCVTVALATWMHQLDLAGGLEVSARQVAYLYQMGRMAAEELSPGLRSRLAPLLAAIQRDEIVPSPAERSC